MGSIVIHGGGTGRVFRGHHAWAFPTQHIFSSVSYTLFFNSSHAAYFKGITWSLRTKNPDLGYAIIKLNILINLLTGNINVQLPRCITPLRRPLRNPNLGSTGTKDAHIQVRGHAHQGRQVYGFKHQLLVDSREMKKRRGTTQLLLQELIAWRCVEIACAWPKLMFYLTTKNQGTHSMSTSVDTIHLTED